MSENREVRWVDRLFESVPLMITFAGFLVAGIGGWLKLKWDVADMQSAQTRWQTNSESRRNDLVKELETLRTRLTVLETLQRCRESGGCK